MVTGLMVDAEIVAVYRNKGNSWSWAAATTHSPVNWGGSVYTTGAILTNDSLKINKYTEGMEAADFWTGTEYEEAVNKHSRKRESFHEFFQKLNLTGRAPALLQNTPI